MIDRGALVLGPPREPGAYRGVYRPPLDAQHFTGRRGRDIAQRYRDAVVAGDGVVEDLDAALALCAAASKIGVPALEVVVFEVPQEPRPGPRALPVAPTPPAEELELLGYDVIEPIEPYWSPLAGKTSPCAVNAFGLIDTRAAADALAAQLTESPEVDEPPVAVRVWRARAGRAA